MPWMPNTLGWLVCWLFDGSCCVHCTVHRVPCTMYLLDVLFNLKDISIGLTNGRTDGWMDEWMDALYLLSSIRYSFSLCLVLLSRLLPFHFIFAVCFFLYLSLSRCVCTSNQAWRVCKRYLMSLVSGIRHNIALNSVFTLASIIKTKHTSKNTFAYFSKLITMMTIAIEWNGIESNQNETNGIVYYCVWYGMVW